MTDFRKLKPDQLGTLYDSFKKTVESYPDNPALRIPKKKDRDYYPEGFEITWKELKIEVDKFIKLYKASNFGVGNRVAILFNQRPEFFFHYLALNSLGASIVPVNPDYKVDEISYLLEHSEADLFINLQTKKHVLEEIDYLKSSQLPSIEIDNFNNIIPKLKNKPIAEKPTYSTEAAILYTSGTTGRPKGCILTNEYFHNFGLSYITKGGLLQFDEGKEVIYNPLPLHHANCLSISVPTTILLGGCLVFPERFHASTWWEDIYSCNVTSVQMQGIIPNILLKLPANSYDNKHKVKFALCAGIEPNHHEVFEKRFGFPVVEMWAMTETGRLISDNFAPRKIHTRSFGKVDNGVEAKIIDADGNTLGANEPGEFVIRNSAEAPRKGFFSGYLKDNKATEDSWQNGWFHTGDSAIYDEDGYFYFLDRMKNIIRRAGENIAAAEIEAIITKHDKVKQVAVLAVPDEIREEEVMACIVLKENLEASLETSLDIIDWCREFLAYFKLPGWILFMEKLPIGTSQKVQKVNIFAKNIDPRTLDGTYDLRKFKKK